MYDGGITLGSAGMEVSDEQKESRNQSLAHVFCLPTNPRLPNDMLLRDPRTWLMLSLVMVVSMIFVTLLGAVWELIERAGLLTVMGPDGSVRWGLWSVFLSILLLCMVALVSGLMCVRARPYLMTRGVRLMTISNLGICLVVVGWLTAAAVLEVI